MPHRSLVVLVVALIAFNLPVSAHASEVVKLARLVLTGKRVGAEPQHRESAPATTDKSAPTPIAAVVGAVGAVGADPGNSTSVEPTPSAATSTGGAVHGQTFLRPF